METEAERVRLTAGEGDVENLAISTPRAGPQSNAKKREIKNQTEKSKKSKPIRSIEGRETVLFDFAGNQNNQTKIKNTRSRLWRSLRSVAKGRQYGKRWSKTGRGKTEESGHAKDTGRQSRQASDRSRELHNRQRIGTTERTAFLFISQSKRDIQDRVRLAEKHRVYAGNTAVQLGRVRILQSEMA